MRIARTLGSVVRPAVVLLAVFLFVGFAGLAYQTIRTIQQLNAVEAERDVWQRPTDVIAALHLSNGDSVVDFGSGAGYFALKLSGAVGPNGSVTAVDLRGFSLFILRVREALRWRNNIHIVVGESEDPHLPETMIDAILIANTYHELTAPRKMLHSLSRLLRHGGHLVIVDRSPAPDEDASETSGHHHVSPDAVESDLRNEGLQILAREDSFTIQPGGDHWWLLTAVQP